MIWILKIASVIFCVRSIAIKIGPRVRPKKVLINPFYPLKSSTGSYIARLVDFGLRMSLGTVKRGNGGQGKSHPIDGSIWQLLCLIAQKKK